MRGLEQIKSINENPHGFHGDSNEIEQHGNAPRSHDALNDLDRSHRAASGGRPTNERLKKILEEITGGQPKGTAFAKNHGIASLINSATGGEMTPQEVKEMAAVGTVFDLLGIPAPDDYETAKRVATVLAIKTITTLDKAIGDKPKTLAERSRLNDKGDRFLGMDGIHAAIGAKPDFIAFWAKLNEQRADRGEGEALYREAKLAFSGGETPVGSLTFIGKEWDGLRAIPATSPHGKTYHGEFRSVAPDGNSIWNVVSNTTELPIAYATAEAALNGARHARIHAEAHRQS